MKRRCEHGEVVITIEHGVAWVEIDHTGDVLDDGIAERRPATIVVTCCSCGQVATVKENRTRLLPRWARHTTEKALVYWRANDRQTYVPATVAE